MLKNQGVKGGRKKESLFEIQTCKVCTSPFQPSFCYNSANVQLFFGSLSVIELLSPNF